MEARRLLAVDLVPTKLDVPDTPTYSDEFLRGRVGGVTIGVGNAGDWTLADTTLEIRIILSLDRQIDDADDSWDRDIDLRLDAGESHEEVVNPGTAFGFPAGRYYLGLQLDPNDWISESNESNNVLWTSAPVVRVTNDIYTSGVISGTSGDDVIVLEQNNALFVTVNGVLRAVDPYYGFQVTDVRIDGLAGHDRIVAQPGTIGHPYYGGDDVGWLLGQLRINGGDGDDTIIGGDGDDLLSGNAGKDRIFGGLGRDRLNGHGGHDRLYGEANVDRLYGYAGNDWIDGGSSTDRLYAGTGTDTLLGQGGNDYLYARNATFSSVFGGGGTDRAQVDDEDELGSIEELLA